MEHFISFIQGQRGEASRLGSKDSGINASARGWNCGFRIRGSYVEYAEQDRFTCYATHGSNNCRSDEWAAQVTYDSKDGYVLTANPDLLKVIPKEEFIELRDELIEIMRSGKSKGEMAEDILLHLNYKEEDGPND